jgi:hypothetical protein
MKRAVQLATATLASQRPAAPEVVAPAVPNDVRIFRLETKLEKLLGGVEVDRNKIIEGADLLRVAIVEVAQAYSEVEADAETNEAFGRTAKLLAKSLALLGATMSCLEDSGALR